MSIVIQEILTSDTPNTGREKINQNFQSLSDNYLSHLSDTNPHDTSLTDISYAVETFSEYSQISDAKEGLDYAISQLRSHFFDNANPHSTSASQLLDVTESALITNNLITTTSQINNALNGIKFLYNKSLSLSNASGISLSSVNFTSSNVLAGFNEIDLNFTKRTREEAISEVWSFNEGLNFENGINGDDVEISNSFSFSTSLTSEVNFVDDYFYFKGNEFELDNGYVNINANLSLVINSPTDTELNLNSSIINFSGSSSTFLNFQDTTEFNVSAGKTLQFLGNKVAFNTNNSIEFFSPAKAMYSPQSQLAANLDDYVTRRYVDQLTLEIDSFFSDNPLLYDVSNIRDALNVVANELATAVKDDYSFSLSPMGAKFILEPNSSEKYITIPVKVYPMNDVYITSVAYYLPSNVQVTVNVKDVSGYDLSVDSSVANTAFETVTYEDSSTQQNYYNFLEDEEVLIPNATSNTYIRLLEIFLTNISLSNSVVVNPVHSFSFSLKPKTLVPVTSTTTTTTAI